LSERHLRGPAEVFRAELLNGVSEFYTASDPGCSATLTSLGAQTWLGHTHTRPETPPLDPLLGVLQTGLRLWPWPGGVCRLWSQSKRHRL